MRALTVFAHHGSGSFCHAVLERFDAGLRDRDDPNWMDADAPDEVLARMHLRERILGGVGRPLKRFAMKRWLGHRDTRGIIRLLQRHRPADVLEQQDHVKKANALAFIAPMYFVGFPAILKGWIERVFTLGFAFGITPEAWNGDLGGRVPLLTHEKALIIQTTIFDERAYDAGLRQAMHVLIDEFALRYPRIKRVERESFYAVHDGDTDKLRGYLDRAYALGREF